MSAQLQSACYARGPLAGLPLIGTAEALARLPQARRDAYLAGRGPDDTRDWLAARPIRVDLTEADLDDWRDAVLFGPDIVPAAVVGDVALNDAAVSDGPVRHRPIPMDAAPPPIAWSDGHGSGGRTVAGLFALIVVLALIGLAL